MDKNKKRNIIKTLKNKDKVLFIPNLGLLEDIPDEAVEGEIAIFDSEIYILNDHYNGSHSIDKRGYEYSWIIKSEFEFLFEEVNYITKVAKAASEKQLLLNLD